MYPRETLGVRIVGVIAKLIGVGSGVPEQRVRSFRRRRRLLAVRGRKAKIHSLPRGWGTAMTSNLATVGLYIAHAHGGREYHNRPTRTCMRSASTLAGVLMILSPST